MSKEEFMTAARAAALASSRASGLPPGVTVAQAALESAWGRSQLAQKANNYFGIKAHGPHAWIELPTSETVNGASIHTRARFARYGSMAECFADRDRLILSSAVYEHARTCAGDPEAFIRALAAHWATDPAYAEKLSAIYRQNELAALDRNYGVDRAAQQSA
jgi:flagellum-specific peptidoglycan hydrolase FlgJ